MVVHRSAEVKQAMKEDPARRNDLAGESNERKEGAPGAGVSVDEAVKSGEEFFIPGQCDGGHRVQLDAEEGDPSGGSRSL